jgi:hypothetical protein
VSGTWNFKQQARTWVDDHVLQTHDEIVSRAVRDEDGSLLRHDETRGVALRADEREAVAIRGAELHERRAGDEAQHLTIEVIDNL